MTLRLLGVGKRYGSGPWVLRDVDLVVEPGAVVAITGGNGSGKSTLLRTAIGLSRPTLGQVVGLPEVVGYVPDRFPPGERLSAAAYLTHLGRVRGLTTKAAAARAAELLDRLALVGGADAPLRTLSKGNAQKVAVAQAVLVPPGLLVLDEPWSGLDASAHGALAGIIAEVAAEGGSVVFTDHRESTTRATTTYRIARGRVTPLREVVEVVLRRPDGAADPRWPGALSPTHQGDRVTLDVAPPDLDGLLLAALHDGWSVVRVVPR